MNFRLKLSPISEFHFDRLLLTVCISLLLIGYVMVASSSMHLGVTMAGNSLYYPLKQLMHISLGLILAAALTTVPMRIWEKAGPWLFIVGLLLLIGVLVRGLGIKVNGSVRWLSIGGLRIQVSEVVKFFAVIYMAGYVNRHYQSISESAFGLLKPLLLFSLACVLLLLEPDFGSAIVILMIAMGIMFLGGARLSQFIILLLSVAMLATLLVYFSPYRLVRVMSFMNPWADPLNTGFQLVQALISFGRGEWLGVGLGSGIQKLFYLPEAHTDFLFSVIAEELGLVGVITVIGLFSLLVWRAFEIAAAAEKAGQRFSAFIAYGLGIWFGFQSFVNMGVNMGILPTKGLTLPLMSYGGGSMIIMCCAVALLLRVHNEVAEINANTPKGKSEWTSA
ncbi:integral membrane protein involved in stabilizing FstZ ring during cell division [Candidatus Methylobacter favarea]|uniref:Probable peptidoglycan glycosyltransferase FtsW n=1 Tax=Candidatus Methylobacter favarea TaxID=2707345 RepID=A0A8S0Y5Y4_9GAMM|nr:putative lipid II flippase FtsW [Candidatus Methylobacter favarea]CAA9890040.1 integral membrane protein involved in stabilizing FstZ ring during cell division [Candidatus Methylobacter favarea]